MDAENQAVMGERQSVQSRRQRVERTSARAARRARERGEEAAGKARKQIAGMLSDQKHRAVEELDHIGSVLQSTSDNLRSEQEERIARYIESAVHQIENAATYLEDHSIEDIAGQVQRFARREPALFLGGAALVGLIGARFFRSSGHHYRDEYGPAWGRDDERSLRELEGYDTVHGTSGAEMPDPDRARRGQQSPIGTESTAGVRGGTTGGATTGGTAGSTGTMGGTSGGMGSSTATSGGGTSRGSGMTGASQTAGSAGSSQTAGSTGSSGTASGGTSGRPEGTRGPAGTPGTPGATTRSGSTGSTGTSPGRTGETRRPKADEPGEPW